MPKTNREQNKSRALPRRGPARLQWTKVENTWRVPQHTLRQDFSSSSCRPEGPAPALAQIARRAAWCTETHTYFEVQGGHLTAALRT